jgi:hypothetical protein
VTPAHYVNGNDFMNIRLLLIIFVSSGLVRVSPAQEAPNFLDVIPANSRIGLSWPKVTRLGPKANTLAQEIYPGSGQMILDAARSFFTEAGVDYRDPDFTKIIDRQRPGAVFGVKIGAIYDQVNVLPVGDLEKLATMLGVDRGQLEMGEVLLAKRQVYVKYGGGFLYASRKQDALTSVKIDSPIGKRLTEKQRSEFLSSDALLFLDKEIAVDFMNGFFDWFGDLSWLTNSDENAPTDEFTELISSSGKEFSFGLAGFDIDGGLGIKYTNFFNEVRDSRVQKLIKSIRGGDGATNLDHLPNDNFVAAFAARGTGKKNVMMAKAFLKAIVNRVSPGEEVLAADDKPVFYDSFAKIWEQLNGTRVGVYRIESQEAADGNLAAVVIFDVSDPKLLLAQLPELVRFANESAERNTAKEDLLPIRFNYLPDKTKIRGFPVDVLEVDTRRLDDETSKRFRVLFGEQAKQFKFVPVKNHLLMLVGTQTDLLTQTIDNLANGNSGLSLHPAIESANKRMDARRKIEAHLSFRNLLDIYSFKEKPKPYLESDEVASLAFTIEPDRVGVDSWLPAKEIDAAIDWSLLWY